MRNIRDIQAQIVKHEEEVAVLMPLLKEEIFNVLKASGGLSLDYKLLAGLAVYAGSAEGKNSKFLHELAVVGSQYLPRSQQGKGRGGSKAKPTADLPKEAVIKGEKIDE